MNATLRCIRVVGIGRHYLKVLSKLHVSSFRAMSDQVSKAQEAKLGGELKAPENAYNRVKLNCRVK